MSDGKFETGVFRRLLDAILPADKHGASKALVDESERGADHLFLFALGEDDALGITPHALLNRLHESARSDHGAPIARRDRPSCRRSGGARRRCPSPQAPRRAE